MIVQRVIGFVSFFAILIIGTGDVTAFVDITSACIVLLGTLGMLLVGGGDIPRMFGAVFSNEATPEELRTGLDGWKLARNSSLASGGVAAMAGVIIMLKGIADPAAIGPGMALALLGMLYAMVVGYGICLPLQVRLEDRAGEGGEGAEEGLTAGATRVFIYAFVLSLGTFALLVASVSGALS